MNELRIAFNEVFATWFSYLELALNKDRFLVLPLGDNYACRTCKKKLSIRFTKEYASILCGCGCRIFYPPRKEDAGVIISKYVSKQEYEGNGWKKKETV